MISIFYILSVLLVLHSSVECFTGGRPKVTEDLLSELSDRIKGYQVMRAKRYTPPFSWAEKLGLYQSDIRFMVSGGPLQTEVRQGGAIFDNDMFSTGWILTVLLESVLYGKGAPQPDINRLQLALDSMNDFQDRNLPDVKVSPIKTFWPQVFNTTYQNWISEPDNVRELCLGFDKLPWGSVQAFLRLVRLDKYANDIESFKGLVRDAITAFRIPPDFDDTYLNVGLGATLKKMQDMYPGVYDKWSQRNQNMDILVKATTKYSYDPFSDDPNKSLIDPRTYFFARKFLVDAKKANQTKLSLITTWIQNIDEQRTLNDKGVSMPFNLNNVDVTVCANSIYGIASAAIYDVNGFQSLFLQSEDIQQTFLNTTKFISWAIKTNYTNRPDLAQVYYPSNYNFLWYASRTLFLLSNDLASTKNPIKDDKLRNILVEARDYLQDAFEGYVTEDLRLKAKNDNDQTELFFDDFLGLNDTNIFGQVKATGEDRIFSTSQAANILIATWTFQDENSKSLVYKSNTPTIAKYLIDASTKWLQKNVFNKSLKPLNAFFSGSVKSSATLPYWYPANYFQYLNGTSVDPSQINYDYELFDMFVGVLGVIDEEEYEKELLVPHFNVSTPIEFPGYNTKEASFPFWSSDPYTYSVALLAISQYNNIEK